MAPRSRRRRPGAAARPEDPTRGAVGGYRLEAGAVLREVVGDDGEPLLVDALESADVALVFARTGGEELEEATGVEAGVEGVADLREQAARARAASSVTANSSS